MSYRENWFWFSIGDSIIEHPIITREQNEGNYTYYLFNKFKIYTKKENNTVENIIDYDSAYKISIIVPVYNTEKYLERCLNSIINQTLKEIEIICVNDGSTDNSLSILEKYASLDNRIKIINQENQGLSIARNNGLKVAIGEYIGYVDSDDWISENFYELLYNNAIKYGADIACGEIVRPNALKHKNFLSLYKIKTYTKTEDKYNACYIPKKSYVWNKIYKRDSLIDSKVQFVPHVTYEDILWTHKVVDKLGKLVTVPNAIYYYFVNNNSITLEDNKQHLKNYIQANIETIKYLLEHRIKIKNYKAYRPQKRIRINILGIRFFDCFFWEEVKIFNILGIPVLKIFINKI